MRTKTDKIEQEYTLYSLNKDNPVTLSTFKSYRVRMSMTEIFKRRRNNLIIIKNMNKEIWKDISWYNWDYQVSNYWSIISFKCGKEKLLKKNKNNCWYFSVSLYKNWMKIFLIHRLVAQRFIPNTEDKKEINHINWIKDDNRVGNLEWTTHSENELHKYKKLWFKWPNFWNVWTYNTKSVKINQYDLEWNFIKTWGSINLACIKLWVSAWAIHACIKKTWKTAGWFIWKYSI